MGFNGRFLGLVFFFTSWGFQYVYGGGGRWEVLQDNIGIVAMHMQLLHNDRVVIFDRTDLGRSNLSLPMNRCRRNPLERVVKLDCTAHSVEYNVLKNTFRALMVQTDVWCSSGSVTRDGILVQTGGFNDGDRMVRSFTPCDDDKCDWLEIGNELAKRRWYATNHVLPDGRQIVVGGRNQFNYEFYPKTGNPGAVEFPFLSQTNDIGMENNLYPFVFLNVDGNLFVFANNRAVLLDYKTNKVVKNYPKIPGGDPRSYPSTGSAVLLPLRLIPSPKLVASVEVLVCGGAPKGSYNAAKTGNFVRSLDSCARINVNDPNPVWEIETMPAARVMGDMTLLPNGEVLIINGAGSGTAGWNLGRDPTFNPVLYKPYSRRFEIQNPTTIPRLYHSTAILLRDGRVLVGGNNPHAGYEFGDKALFPTELRLEAFRPSYLDPQFDQIRPVIVSQSATTLVSYGQEIVIRFSVVGNLSRDSVSVTMVAPSFTTHSFAMNHRLLQLGNQRITAASARSTYDVSVALPGSATLAPSGYYMVFVVHQRIPSVGTWILIK